MMKDRQIVELKNASRVGCKDRFGRVIGFDAANGDTYRAGWRVQWMFGGLVTHQEHELRLVSREEYDAYQETERHPFGT